MRVKRTLAGFLLALFLLITSIRLVCFFKPFYSFEYNKNSTVEVTGIAQDDLLGATQTLFDFLNGKRDDIDYILPDGSRIFNEHEYLHMLDVRKLYQHAIVVQWISLAAAAVLFISRKSKKQVFAGYQTGCTCFLILMAFIAVWAIADFTNFWLAFHRLFFDNDLYFMDPNTEVMINMVPSAFFFDLVLLILLLFVLFVIVLYCIFRKRTAQ